MQNIEKTGNLPAALPRPKQQKSRGELLKVLKVPGTLPHVEGDEIVAQHGLKEAIKIVGRTLGRLKKMRNDMIARGQRGSWLYDVNMHLNLCSAVRNEEALLHRLLSKPEANWPRHFVPGIDTASFRRETEHMLRDLRHLRVIEAR